MQTFQRLRPCVDSAGHRFASQFPPAGQYGYVQVVCTRCGMTSQEARGYGASK